jgi:hypothetical protein
VTTIISAGFKNLYFSCELIEQQIVSISYTAAATGYKLQGLQAT